MPNLTTNLGLTKPLENEYYDINVYNANMDLLDTTIKGVDEKVDTIELKAEKVSIADIANNFTSTTVEGALGELFQNADNGKNTIATSIGSPLLNTDTFVAMGTKIDTQIARGVTIANDLLGRF